MAVKRWRGPDVLVVGWIPFHIIPPSHAAGFPAGVSTTVLFQSGNPSPPIGFGGYDGFSSWLHPKSPIGTKEYRAAVYLQGVEAEFPGDGAPPRVDRAANGSFIGYTPFRLFIGGVNVAATFPQFAQYKKGTGPRYSPTTSRDPAGTWVELRYRAEFKLSALANLVSRVAAGAWSPYAWCEIVYRFDESGRVDIRVEGSAIPNQRLYIDWARPMADPVAGINPEHDILTANRAAVAGFIQTLGWGCKPAPKASRLGWHGLATPSS
jgi:hypothetical protein